MDEAYDGRQVVGMDLHRRRSVLVRLAWTGGSWEPCADSRNSPRGAVRRCWPGAGGIPAGGARGDVRVVLGKLSDVLAEAGCGGAPGASAGREGVQGSGRVKNDERDAADLADLLRAGLLPEALIAPAGVRALREVVRYRHKLVQQRTSCKDQVHAVLAKLGVPVTHARMSSAAAAGCGWTSWSCQPPLCREGGLAARPDRGAGRRDRPARGPGRGPCWPPHPRCTCLTRFAGQYGDAVMRTSERRLGLLMLAAAAGTNVPTPLLLVYREQLTCPPRRSPRSSASTRWA